MIELIKTLPHVYPLFLNEGQTVIYSKNFTLDAYNVLDRTQLFSKKDLLYSDFMTRLQKINDDSQLRSLEFNELVSNSKNNTNNFTQFKRVDSVEEMLEFNIRGDSITIWLPGYINPLKLEFFDQECEEIFLVDSITKRRIEPLDFIIFSHFLPRDEGILEDLKIKIGNDTLLKKIFTTKLVAQSQNFLELQNILTDFIYPPLFYANEKVMQTEIDNLHDQGFEILLFTRELERLPHYLKEFRLEKKVSKFKKPFSLSLLKDLPAGFISREYNIAFFTDRELFGSLFLSRAKSTLKKVSNADKLLQQFEGSIEIGDFVVHEDYGIAIYKGIQAEYIEGISNDYLVLWFANEDELYVPLNQIDKVTKYIGNEGIDPELTKLGRAGWKALKTKAKKQAYISAKELVTHIAKREISQATPVSSKDSNEYLDFVKRFPFKETKDQLQAINEILFDISKDTPMNRLLVGDVGFGKTEVMMRAVFKIIEARGQVVILAPTTVLASQHFITFQERFSSKAEIALISRFNTSKENKVSIDKANNGEIDVLIGTHRLLSSDVKLKNLQLVVVDEEQKFGVKQKEKLKQINYGSHVLSVSATPIPRTLSLALSSVQDISIITTPPQNRKPIKTEIIYNSFEKAANAIQHELSRGGQVYFIHNEVKTIEAITKKLQALLPTISISNAHGQMSSKELKRKMAEFMSEKVDVLVATSIIENGLDLKNVNTIIIHNAHKFGLSQLYQMRGRVGRSDKQAFCYLMAPSWKSSNIEGELTLPQLQDKNYLKKKYKQKLYIERLQSLVENQDLGAGFRIASKDLEIRGAGDFLGAKQHGHISKVGYALYMEMLAEAIEREKSLSADI